MNNEMTPMTRMKQSINTFKSFTEPYFKEVNLNKAKSEYKYISTWGESHSTKGVESDFIKIFKSNTMEDVSFAFAFTYIGKEELEQTVEVSIKNGKSNDSIVGNFPISIYDFRMKLNAINKQLNIEQVVTPLMIMEKITTVFLDKLLDFNAEYNQKVEDLAKYTQEVSEQLQLPLLESQYTKSNQELKKAKKNVQKDLGASLEEAEVIKLEKQLSQAYRKRDKLTKSLTVKYDVVNLEKNERLQSNNLQKAKKQLSEKIESHIDQLPNYLAKKIKMK